MNKSLASYGLIMPEAVSCQDLRVGWRSFRMAVPDPWCLWSELSWRKQSTPSFRNVARISNSLPALLYPLFIHAHLFLGIIWCSRIASLSTTPWWISKLFCISCAIWSMSWLKALCQPRTTGVWAGYWHLTWWLQGIFPEDITFCHLCGSLTRFHQHQTCCSSTSKSWYCFLGCSLSIFRAELFSQQSKTRTLWPSCRWSRAP